MRDPEAPSLVRLPEHVVLEILARVPCVADLFHCAAVRKRWRHLVTEPSFLRRRWPEGACHCSSLVGFLGRERRRGGEGPPGSSFVREPVRHLIRLHFAKRDETLCGALNRLEDMRKKIPARR